MSKTGSRESRSTSEMRALWAFLIALVGLMTAFVVVALRWNDESGVAALGAVASSIAAIVSGYYGFQYSQSASDKKRRPR